jgi:hypothetical protein
MTRFRTVIRIIADNDFELALVHGVVSVARPVAVPYTSNAQKAEWEVVTTGWTWENSNGTIGLGRVPAKTYEEAVEVMNKVNARYAPAR